jgi:hypothetical protein
LADGAEGDGGCGVTRKERQDVLMFLGFIGLLLAAVAVVLLVRNEWPETRWVALGAIAAAVQTLGVFIALAYAAAQVRVAREESRRRRRDELIDRLVDVCDELLSGWNGARGAWWSITHVLELAAAGDYPSNARIGAFLDEEYERAKQDLQVAERSISSAFSRLRRVLQLLDLRTPLCVVRLVHDATGTVTSELPALGQPPASDEGRAGRLEAAEGAATDVRAWLNQYIAEHVKE